MKKMFKSKRGLIVELLGSPMAIIAIGFVIIMFLLFGPAIWKIWEFTFTQNFDFGNPVIITIVALVVLIFLLRRR